MRYFTGCRLKGVLHEALECLFKVLDSYTLADFVENNEGLSSRFCWADLYDKMK